MRISFFCICRRFSCRRFLFLRHYMYLVNGIRDSAERGETSPRTARFYFFNRRKKFIIVAIIFKTMLKITYKANNPKTIFKNLVIALSLFHKFLKKSLTSSTIFSAVFFAAESLSSKPPARLLLAYGNSLVPSKNEK